MKNMLTSKFAGALLLTFIGGTLVASYPTGALILVSVGGILVGSDRSIFK